MECHSTEFDIGWSGNRRILVEIEPSRGVEFGLSSDGKHISSEYWILGENISNRDVEVMRLAAEDFRRRQHGESD
jgi:hypothetical protein